MAKRIVGAEIVFRVTDDGTLKEVGSSADKTAKQINKLGGASQTTDRRIKGVTRQSSNATKNFSKQAQTMQGGIVAVYATIAAQVFAVSAAFMFLKEAFETRNLIEGQLAFGAATGVAYKTLTLNIQDATGGMIAYKEAAQAAAIGTAAGLSASQLERLGKVAKNTSLALGRDLTDAFNRLVRGTTKAEPELLDELGIILRLEPAMKKYAASVGKNAADLNQFEKSQAVANEVLEQGESKFAAIEKTMDESGFALARFLKTFDDLMIGVKTWVSNIMIPIIDFFSKNLTSLVAAMTVFLIPILRKILPSLSTASANFKLKADAHVLALGREVAALKAYETQLLHTQQLGSKDIATGDVAAQGARMDVDPSSASGYRRAVQHFDKQTLQLADVDDPLKERTGKFKDSNETMVRDMDKSLNIMTGKTKSWALKAKVAFTKMGFNFNIVTTKMKMKWQGLMTFMTTATAWMVAKVNMLMKGLFILGMIMMVFDLLKMLWNWLIPPDKVKMAQQDFLDSTIEKYTTLSTEIEAMQEMQTLGVQNLSQTVLQLGNAFKSVDLGKVVEDYNKLLASGKIDTDEGEQLIEGTIGSLSKLVGEDVPQLKQFYALVKSGKPITKGMLALDLEIGRANKIKREEWDEAGISLQAQNAVTDEGAQSWQAFAENMENAATATSQMAEAQKSLTMSLRKGLGGVKKLPFQDIMLALKGMEESRDAVAFAEEIGMDTLERGGVSAKANREEAEKKAGTGVSRGTTFIRNLGAAFGAKGKLADKRETINLSNRNALLEDAISLEDAANLRIKEGNEDLKDNAKISENLNDWQITGNALQEEYKGHLLDEIGYKQTAAEIGFGSTAAQKNLREELKSTIKAGKAAKAVTQEKQAQFAIDTMKATATTEEKEAMEFELLQAKKNIKLTKAQSDLQVKVTALKVFQNTLGEEKLEMDRRLAENGQKRALLEQEITLSLERSLSVTRDMELGEMKVVSMRGGVADLAEKEAFWKEKVAAYNDEIVQDVAYLLTLENNLLTTTGQRLKLEKDITAELYAQSMLKVVEDAQRGVADSTLGYQQEFGRMNTGGGPFGAMGGAIKGISPAQEIMTGYLKDAKVGSIAAFETKAYTKELDALMLVNKDLGDAKRTQLELETQATAVAAQHTAQLKKSALAQAEMNIKMELMEGVRSTIEGGFDKMFDALLDGTTSFGEAMKTLAADILKDLAKMYLKAAMMQALTAATGFPMGRYGGQFSGSGKSFAYGGVSTGPQSGHMAMLHGTEAIIPLGNDRSIPVQLSGSQANTVNVAVNVNGQNSSVNTSGGGADAQALGRSIGGLIQQHLQQEMRPGGLLNKQGQGGP